MDASALHFQRSLEGLQSLTRHDLRCEGLDLSDSEWDRFNGNRPAYFLEVATWAKSAIWDALVQRALLTGGSDAG